MTMKEVLDQYAWQADQVGEMRPIYDALCRVVEEMPHGDAADCSDHFRCRLTAILGIEQLEEKL